MKLIHTGALSVCLPNPKFILKRPQSFEDAAEEIALIMCIQKGRPKGDSMCEAPIQYFQGAEPWGRWSEEMIYDRGGEEFLMDVRPQDLDRPLDVSLVAHFTDRARSEEEDREDIAPLYRIRGIQPKEARGRTNGPMGQYLIEWTAGILRTNGHWTCGRNYYASDDARSWRHVGPWWRGAPQRGEEKHEFNDLVRVAHGMQFTRYYDWRVEMGMVDGVTVSIPTTPEGCRETYRLRDVAPGKSRRDALRNWVTRHMRRTRRRPANDNADERERLTWVRQHLRGATRFSWNGLVCNIHPSAYDLKRLKEAV